MSGKGGATLLFCIHPVGLGQLCSNVLVEGVS